MFGQVLGLTMQIMQVRYDQLSATLEGIKLTGVPLVSWHNRGSVYDALHLSGIYKPSCINDDLGSYYFIPKLAILFNLNVDVSIQIFYTSLIVMAFVSGSLGFWCLLKTKVGRVVCLFALGLLSLVVWRFGDVYVVAACVTVALFPWCIYIDKFSSSKNTLVYYLVAGILIGLSHFTRAHAGSGVFIFIFAYMLLSRKHEIKQKIISLFFLLIGIGLIFLFFSNLVSQRDRFLRGVDSSYTVPVAKHPFWHSVYIGFAFLDNDYVERYKDEVAIKKVESVRPGTLYLSEDYENILKNEVIKLVKNARSFVAMTIFAKMGVVLGLLLCFSNIGLLLSLICKKEERGCFELSFWLAAAFAALPGILVVPQPNYISGFIAFATLYGILNIDDALSMIDYPNNKEKLLNESGEKLCVD